MVALNKIGVVGAGAMGRNIALFFAQTGHQVQLFDVSPEAVTSALDAVAQTLGRAVEKQRVSANAAEATKERLHAAKTLDDFADCDLVIEQSSKISKLNKNCLHSLRRYAPMIACWRPTRRRSASLQFLQN